MTISTTTRKYQYNGNGVTTVFAYNSVFYDSSDLVVVRTQISTGADTPLTITTDYTITGGNGATGNVTMVTAPTNDQRITITSALPNTQTTDFKDNEPFRANEVETGLDKLTIQVQELSEEVGRSIKLKATTTTSTPTFPEPVASQFVRWNAAANALETTPLSDLSAIPVSAYMQTVLAETSPVNARTNLGAASTASPTLTGTVTADTIQTSGSSGIVLRNSSGTTVATFGPTNTTNASIAGGLTLGTALGATSGGTGAATYTTGDILYASATNTLAKRAIGTTGQVLTVAGGVPTWATPASSGLSVTNNYLYVRDERTSGTSGGSTTSGATAARPLNTVVVNTISGASLSSNQVTLPAGTYYIKGSGPANIAGQHKLRLRNVTDSTYVLEGPSNYSGVGTAGVIQQTLATITGQITIAGTKVFELRHYVINGDTNGFGLAISQGTEVYGELEIWKVA